MAEGILGLGTGQSTSLNSDLITKLKTAETKAVVTPIETKITNLKTETDFLASVETKVNELLTAVKPFDLFVTGGVNALQQKSATTSGDSVTFDAADVSALNKGFTTVSVTKLAQKDVYQSKIINKTDAPNLTSSNQLNINGVKYPLDKGAPYASYDELISAINTQSGVDASLEQVGTNSYRLVLKSESTGTDNALIISGAGSSSLFINKDTYQSNVFTDSTKQVNKGNLIINGETIDTSNKTYDDLATEITSKTGMDASVVPDGDSFRLVINAEDLSSNLAISGDASTALGLNISTNHTNNTHVLTAQNMNATVDGIAYDVSTNNITVNGLKITANKLDTKDSSGNYTSSTINVSEDTTNVETQMNSFVTKYNELVSLVGNEINNADSKVENKSALKDILSQVKDKLFGSYGASSNKSIFNYGFELDKSGTLSLNSTTFKSAIQNDMSGLRDLFIGTAEKKGLGTTLKETIDGMSYSGGLLSNYDNDISNRQTKLTESKTKAEDALTAKYSQLASQFSAYTTLITQMESSFSGLKMMIQQSTTSNN